MAPIPRLPAARVHIAVDGLDRLAGNARCEPSPTPYRKPTTMWFRVGCEPGDVEAGERSAGHGTSRPGPSRSDLAPCPGRRFPATVSPGGLLCRLLFEGVDRGFELVGANGIQRPDGMAVILDGRIGLYWLASQEQASLMQQPISSAGIVDSYALRQRRRRPPPSRLRSRLWCDCTDANGTRPLHRPGRRGLKPPSMTRARIHQSHFRSSSALLHSGYARWRDAEECAFAVGDRQPLLKEPWTFLH